MIRFFLLPMYAHPELLEGISPELRKRMQGKACFNFTKVDETLFAELEALTARTVPGFRETAEAAAAGRP